MKCPSCHIDNPEGVKFCGECGQSLEAQVTCSSCGHKNPPGVKFCHECGRPLSQSQTAAPTPPKPSSFPASVPVPTSFANGRYQVKKFLGEGGKKKVYLAHDATLDRDVAFALIKTEKLDEAGRTRIKREAQAMGRLDHPNIVSILDFGDHEGQPYMVLPLLSGGDVEGVIKKAVDHRLPIEEAIEIAESVAKGLEFAHSKGIIHRDIKPGNVWMSGEGTAKVGDFGLAVAVDLSRLTQDGMMVGTVSYMPPEQAMGGKVTAKADLYSLGAMLYEMVTGRPPFVGDDSVAIIGQHINTPPVSPTWHRADLPPALETLILQLLEKDPEKRPQSATVVLQALETIEKGKAKKEPTKEGTAAPAENPLYRKVFVGREPELKQLQSTFDGAISGQGALMMVSGEPGIGKTSLCEQLSTYVTLRGGKTLVGHCYEEGSLSLPYLAFVEAMRSYVLTRDPKDLREDLGSGATDVARIVSEIREKLKVEPRAAERPEEDRYRLMQAVTGFLTNAAAIQPLVIVLEDLHDADKGTLDMLTHISRHLAGSRLLIVGTYRDVEVDRSHPLSAALADLRRVSNFGRVTLKGLNADEVRRMLESITRESVPWGLAEAIHRQTEGNPLFVQEVIRHLSEEGLLVHEGGKWKSTKETPLEMSIPEGLRDVIGKRLSFLSSNTNEMLSVAAVIGREFQLDTLRGVVTLNEVVFVKSLKEAVQVSVLEERSQVGQLRYRFTHALFRQILYDEMIAPQRLSLHQQVARSLEAQYANRLEEHAVELAEHFSQSTDRADLAKAVSYGEMAAKRAIQVYAFGEAVRMLRQSLKIQKVLDPANKEKQCELLLQLSQALSDAGEPRRALDVELPEALALAEAIGDNTRAANSCVEALRALGLYGIGPAVEREGDPWIHKLDRYAQPDTIERLWADFHKLSSEIRREHYAKDVQARYRRLAERGRVFGDETLSNSILASSLLNVNLTAEEALPIAEELASLSYPSSKRSSAYYFLRYGKRDRAEEMFRISKALAQRSGQVNAVIYSMETDTKIATLDGRLAEVVTITDRMIAYGREVNLDEFAWIRSVWAGLRPRVYLGNAADYLESTLEKMLKEETNAGIHQLIPLLMAYLGMRETTDRLDEMSASRTHMDSLDDTINISVDLALLEAAVLTNHHLVAEQLLHRLAGQNTSGQITPLIETCVARHLGAAAALLGKHDEARKHYQEAIRVCTEIRFRPELALTRLQLAELILAHYPNEKKEALEHLDFGIKEFREMKMQPSLERALRHKDILKA